MGNRHEDTIKLQKLLVDSDNLTEGDTHVIQSLAESLEGSEDCKLVVTLLVSTVVKQNKMLGQHEKKLQEYDTMYKQWRGGLMLILAMGGIVGWLATVWDKFRR